jgi:hypothetical protein
MQRKILPQGAESNDLLSQYVDYAQSLAAFQGTLEWLDCKEIPLEMRLSGMRLCLQHGAIAIMKGNALLRGLDSPAGDAFCPNSIESMLPLMHDTTITCAVELYMQGPFDISRSVMESIESVKSICGGISGDLGEAYRKWETISDSACPLASPASLGSTTVTWGVAFPPFIAQGVSAMFAPAPSGGSPDTDGDGLSDLEERAAQTDPLSADSDGDGLNDGHEVNITGTDPRKGDTDGDGLSDSNDANPSVPFADNPFYSGWQDLDGDGISDDDERAYGTSTILRDTDGDGLSDGQELALGTDPLLWDSDGDGIGDLPDHGPLDPAVGQSGIDKDDDEELFMAIYGTIAIGASIGSLFGCASCSGIALKAAYEVFCLYERELEERRTGTDE